MVSMIFADKTPINVGVLSRDFADFENIFMNVI
jgi:hypothetical protein